MDLPPPPVDEVEVEVVQHDPAEARVRDALLAYIEARCAPERVRIVHLGTSLRPAQSDVMLWSGDPCRPQPTLRLRVDDSARTVQPVLELWVTGPVAPRDIGPGDVFHVEQGAIPWRMSQGNPLYGRVRARHPIAAGAPVTPRLARRVPDAEHGQAVDLVVKRGNVSISARGVVMTPGFVGDRISVRNTATRVVQRGILVDSKTVSLTP